MPVRRSAAANTAAARLPRCVLPAAWKISAWVSATAAVLIAALCGGALVPSRPYAVVDTDPILRRQSCPETGLEPQRRPERALDQPLRCEPFQPPTGSWTHAPGRRCVQPTPARRARRSCSASLRLALAPRATASSPLRGSQTPLASTYDVYTIIATRGARPCPLPTACGTALLPSDNFCKAARRRRIGGMIGADS